MKCTSTCEVFSLTRTSSLTFSATIEANFQCTIKNDKGTVSCQILNNLNISYRECFSYVSSGNIKLLKQNRKCTKKQSEVFSLTRTSSLTFSATTEANFQCTIKNDKGTVSCQILNNLSISYRECFSNVSSGNIKLLKQNRKCTNSL